MSFRCPDCTKVTLEITVSVDLGPDGNSDENILQTVECAACSLRAVAFYEESRRGSMDRESWHHDGWHVTAAVFERVKNTLLACPSPRDDSCRCAAHAWLGTGGWGVITELRRDGVELGDHFRLQRD